MKSTTYHKKLVDSMAKSGDIMFRSCAKISKSGKMPKLPSLNFFEADLISTFIDENLELFIEHANNFDHYTKKECKAIAEKVADIAAFHTINIV